MPSATCATASRICSSVQPASRASSWRCSCGGRLRLEQRPHVAEQRGLALVAGVELAREGDLVEAEAGLARGALQRRERVLAALVLGDGERDPLLGLAAAACRGGARSGSARRRAAPRGDPASTPMKFEQLPAGCERALQHRDAALRAPSARRGLGTGSPWSSSPLCFRRTDLRVVSVRQKGLAD